MGEVEELGGFLNKGDAQFFVCGIPSDNHGFEYKGLDGWTLPNNFAHHLDIRRDINSADDGNSKYRLFKLSENDNNLVIYAEYRWINPNDNLSSRGAFIAVGCLVKAPFDPYKAIDAVQRIGEIHEDLAKFRDPINNSFTKDFQLKNYNPPAEFETVQTTQLADLLWRVVCGKGQFEKIRDINLTSEQISQGRLSEHLKVTSETQQESSITRPRIPDSQEQLLQFQQFIQASKEYLPQSRRILNRLLALERERNQIINNLAKSFKNSYQTKQFKPQGSARGSKNNYRARSSYPRISTSIWRGFSWQIVAVLVTAILICVTVAIAVFVIWPGS